MNRTATYRLSSSDYARVRRQAEALRRQEIRRLIEAGSRRANEARIALAAIVRRTLDRVRGAGAWTFFGAS
jgi:hypothetical protein